MFSAQTLLTLTAITAFVAAQGRIPILRACIAQLVLGERPDLLPRIANVARFLRTAEAMPRPRQEARLVPVLLPADTTRKATPTPAIGFADVLPLL
jgi:hypothetical protein